jgi:hypothetical protein
MRCSAGSASARRWRSPFTRTCSGMAVASRSPTRGTTRARCRDLRCCRHASQAAQHALASSPPYRGRCRRSRGPCPNQSLRKFLSDLDRFGCLSLRSAFASIWRMRSRVTDDCWPTSSVCSVFLSRHATLRSRPPYRPSRHPVRPAAFPDPRYCRAQSDARFLNSARRQTESQWRKATSTSSIR